jgi:hypothetical protein
MMPNFEKIIKIALAVLLILCLFHMPYGYYQLFRFAAVVGFGILAYYEYERKNIPLVIVFVGLALLFQPLVKVPLGRHVWIIVDVVVAAGLILITVMQNQKEKTT